MRTQGSLHGRTHAQVLCRTNTTLTDGMCGGPVLWDSNPDENGVSEETIAGMIEGIVPLTYEDNKIGSVCRITINKQPFRGY
jgi:hypothetical protein